MIHHISIHDPNLIQCEHKTVLAKPLNPTLSKGLKCIPPDTFAQE